MLAYYQAIRGASSRIASAIHYAVEAFGDKRVEQEPALTDRMLAAIETAFDDYEINGIRWRAKTLTDRGAGAQEKKYGADFMGVLNISLPGFRVSKGFLAQAKIVRGYDIGDLNDLKEQCEKMLKLSPDSFVFLYSTKGIRVVPAISVLGAGDPLQLYDRAAERFFELHFECFIGDRNVSSPTPEALEELRDRLETRTAFLIQAKGGE